MAEQQYVNTENDEKLYAIADIIKTATEVVHCYNTFQEKNEKDWWYIVPGEQVISLANSARIPQRIRSVYQ